MICYIIIFSSLILNLFVHIYNNILYPKFPVYMYVHPEDGPRRPKYLGEIIMTNIFICLNMYNYSE
jgi:hypothetical protein